MFEKKNREITMTQNLRQTPLTCSGHTRPVVFLSFSEFNPEDEANYYSISACKGKFSFFHHMKFSQGRFSGFLLWHCKS